MVRALTDLKIIVSRGDDLSLRRAITYFLNNIAKQTQEQETIAAIGEDMFAVALDQPFRYLPKLTPAAVVYALLSHMQIVHCHAFQHAYLFGARSPACRHRVFRKESYTCTYSCCTFYISAETTANMQMQYTHGKTLYAQVLLLSRLAYLCVCVRCVRRFA